MSVVFYALESADQQALAQNQQQPAEAPPDV